VVVSDGYMTDGFGLSCQYNYTSILKYYSSIIVTIYLISARYSKTLSVRSYYAGMVFQPSALQLVLFGPLPYF